MATDGPLDELVQNFMALKADLEYKMQLQRQFFALKQGDHEAIENPILDRITSAENDIASFTAHLDNVLQPTLETAET